MGKRRVSLISSGASSLTEKTVFTRMLIEKMKLLEIRMTDYVKQIFIEDPEQSDHEEEKRIKGLKPNIQIESEDDGDLENKSEELEIEFEDEGDQVEDDFEMKNGENNMDFGTKFNQEEEKQNDEEKIDL